MTSCSAFGCTNRHTKKVPGITFHRFPLNADRKAEWIKAVSRKDFRPSNSSVLCSNHFLPEMFDRSSLCKVRLKLDAVPTIFDAFPSYMQTTKRTRKAPKRRAEEPFQDEPDLPSFFATPSLPSTSSGALSSTGPLPDSEDSTRLKKKIDSLEAKNNRLLKKVKILQQSKRRLEKRVESLNDIVKSLKEKKMMEDDPLEILSSVAECSKEFLMRQISKQTNTPGPKSFSPELRCFALTLHYLSPRAYEYVRDTFNLALPHKRTISKWYQHIDGEPGFTKEAFSALELRIKSSSSEYAFALMIDEMCIRQHLEFDGKRYHGHIDFGSQQENEIWPLAKHALVFLLVCINDNWKLPIGYFLIESLNSMQRASLVEQSLSLLHEVGAKVISLTFHGIPVNLAMARLLGCSFDLSNMKTHFPHPEDSTQSIAVFPDPCHMLKLVRNTLGEKKVIIDGEGKEVNWRYISALNELQQSEGLHLANKVKNSHINFFTQKMKVSLAAQLLSDSVADAIDFCDKRLEYEEFKNSDATVQFIRIFNNLFDMNSKSIYHRDLKKAVCMGNVSEVMEVLHDSRKYILSLRLSDGGPLLIKSARKTGFLGFLICIESLDHLIFRCLLEPSLTYLPTYKLSQDHLELLFSVIRFKGGCNNNPTAKQFKSTYKKLLVKHELKSSRTGNCLPFGEVSILNVPSSYPPTEVINLTTKSHRVLDNNDVPPLHRPIFHVMMLNEYNLQVTHYLAGYIAKKLSSLIKCHECISALFADVPATVSFIYFKSRGGLVYPSSSVYRICQTCEGIYRETPDCSAYSTRRFHTLLHMEKSAVEKVVGMDLFPDLNRHGFENDPLNNHVLHLIRAIIKEFFKIRINHHCNLANQKQKPVRQLFTKLVLFKGQ